MQAGQATLRQLLEARTLGCSPLAMASRELQPGACALALFLLLGTAWTACVSTLSHSKSWRPVQTRAAAAPQIDGTSTPAAAASAVEGPHTRRRVPGSPGSNSEQPGASGSGDWYANSLQYWEEVDTTDRSMMGAHNVGEHDIAGSRAFLQQIMGQALQGATEGQRHLVALDCGAGVGRVSEKLLLPHFQEVDLVEQSENLFNAAHARLAYRPGSHRAVNFFFSGLQDFTPLPGRYDAVWIQWVLVYLKDDDAIAFLRRLQTGLKPGGVIFVKDNVMQGVTIQLEAQSALARTREHWEAVFDAAGLAVLATQVQPDMPADLMEQRMYALAPRGRT